MNQDRKEIKPIAIPGVHERFYPHFMDLIKGYNNPKVLEVGAGHGAFAQRLWNAGIDVSVCDMYPEIFYFDKVTCKKVDVTKELPYSDQSLDIVVAMEVMEHIYDHERFFFECYRILKPDGLLIVSTPNILSLKSRIHFLFSGFFYSFEPLDHNRNDGLQHLSSLTIDQYDNIAKRSKFKEMQVSFDIRQRISKFYLFLLPLMWLHCKIKKVKFSVHNKFDYLTARILFLSFRK